MLFNSLPSSLILTLLVLLDSLDGLSYGAPNPIAQPLSIPLIRRSQKTRDITELGTWAKKQRLALEAKYGIGQASSDKRSNGMNLLTNQNADSSYFGSLAVGTPPVSYDIILDTGSADFWLAGSNSSSIPTGIPTFDTSASSSFVDLGTSFSIRYGSGAAAGTLGSDVVQMAGFEVSNQTFAVVSQVSANMLTSPVSGILGLGWDTIATSGVKPFWQVLAETDGLLDEPVMAFQLTQFIDDDTARSSEFGGTFTFGAVNSSLYTGEIDYQNIPDGSAGYWILQMTNLQVQGQSLTLSSDSSYAAIDTGTTLVGGPSAMIASLYSQIPGSAAATGEYESYYTYPCDTEVSISLGFGSSSNTWSIAPSAFKLGQLSQDTCLGAFFELSSSGSSTPDWIVGDTFLKNVYSVFRASNPPAIGFANLSSTALAMNGADGALPTPTIGSVISATATGTGSDRAQNSGSRTGGSVPMQGLFVLAVSCLLGVLLQ